MKAFSKLTRNYKDCTPDETIDKINLILKKCRLVIDRKCWTKFISGLYSVRIESTNPSFGTNGKGRSRKYTLASAYAEYMERLQNNLIVLGKPMRKFLLDKIKTKTGFYYYPDEVEFSYDEFIKLPKQLMQELMNFENQINDEKIKDIFEVKNGFKHTLIAVPFYNTSSDSVIYIPLNMVFSITGSTGMAAGNTIEEAIYQALCEILERYSAAKIYFEQLTPPTISNDFLKKFPKEYKLIEEIRSIGTHVEIKDFSCGKGFPSVGIIVYDKNKKNYRLNVGTDSCFQVALSRCLTEILQGYESAEEWLGKFLPVPQKEFSYFSSNDIVSSRARNREYENFTINGNGVFPYTLFQKSQSYPFNEHTFHSQKNYKEEIKTLKKLFEDLGSDLYIRNVSFLGFPSVYVYATNVSVLTGKNVNPSINNYDTTINENMYNIDKLLNNNSNLLLPNFVKEIANLYSESLSKIENSYLEDVFRLKFSDDHIMSKLPLSFLLFLNNFHNKDYDGALRYYNIAIKLLQAEDNAFFKGLRNYIQSIKNGIIDETSEYNRMMQKNLLTILDLPNCPHCYKCKLKLHCETIQDVNTQIRLIKKMNLVKINQINNRNCFYYE